MSKLSPEIDPAARCKRIYKKVPRTQLGGLAGQSHIVPRHHGVCRRAGRERVALEHSVRQSLLPSARPHRMSVISPSSTAFTSAI